MNALLRFLQGVGLGLTIIPAYLHFKGMLTLPTTHVSMLVGTVIWFAASLLIDCTTPTRSIKSNAGSPPSDH